VAKQSKEAGSEDGRPSFSHPVGLSLSLSLSLLSPLLFYIQSAHLRMYVGSLRAARGLQGLILGVY